MYLPSSDRYIEFLTKRKRGSVCVCGVSLFLIVRNIKCLSM